MPLSHEALEPPQTCTGEPFYEYMYEQVQGWLPDTTANWQDPTSSVEQGAALGTCYPWCAWFQAIGNLRRSRPATPANGPDELFPRGILPPPMRARATHF